MKKFVLILLVFSAVHLASCSDSHPADEPQQTEFTKQVSGEETVTRGLPPHECPTCGEIITGICPICYPHIFYAPPVISGAKYINLNTTTTYGYSVFTPYQEFETFSYQWSYTSKSGTPRNHTISGNGWYVTVRFAGSDIIDLTCVVHDFMSGEFIYSDTMEIHSFYQ